MILLRKDQLNSITVTLTELSTDQLPYNWLFVFRLEQAQGDEEYTKRIQLIDISTATDRYNLFELIEGGDVTFDTVGDYQYFCYQMPDSESTDEADGLLVEQGKMKLIDNDEPSYIYSVNSNTYINE